MFVIFLKIFEENINACSLHPAPIHFKVCMPTELKTNVYKSLTEELYALLQGVYSDACVLKLYLEHSNDSVIQNMVNKGWIHDQYVSNVIVFSPSGLSIACTMEPTGSIHGSQICDCGGLYKKWTMSLIELKATSC